MLKSLNKNFFKIQNNHSNLKTELLTVFIHKSLNFSGKYGYVREIWLDVSEKSGKCQGILFCPVCMNPGSLDVCCATFRFCQAFAEPLAC